VASTELQNVASVESMLPNAEANSDVWQAHAAAKGKKHRYKKPGLLGLGVLGILKRDSREAVAPSPGSVVVPSSLRLQFRFPHSQRTPLSRLEGPLKTIWASQAGNCLLHLIAYLHLLRRLLRRRLLLLLLLLIRQPTLMLQHGQTLPHISRTTKSEPCRRRATWIQPAGIGQPCKVCKGRLARYARAFQQNLRWDPQAQFGRGQLQFKSPYRPEALKRRARTRFFLAGLKKTAGLATQTISPSLAWV